VTKLSPEQCTLKEGTQMYQDKHGQDKGPEELSLMTSPLDYSSLYSMSAAPAEFTRDCQLNPEPDKINPGATVSGSLSIADEDTSIQYLDGNNLNRDSMTPNTIIVTRAELHGHGEVPLVESTDMGRVMYCQLSVEHGDVSVYVVIATKKSVRVNRPKWDYYIEPEIKRLEVGALGRVPLIDHDFESGDEITINGESVQSIFVDGGVLDTSEFCESTGPKLVVVFKDRPGEICYQVGYIRLECKPLECKSPVMTPLVTNRKLTKRRYFQVFQCPGHH
jgi:hypothetical protein